MDRIADKFTPLWMPWREALKRAGSFEALRSYLHLGRIPARHGGLYTLSDSEVHSGPGDFKPEQWANAYKDPAGRIVFITEEVVFERVVQEVVFAYAISIELDRGAFDTFFPVAAVPTIVDKVSLPPAEQKLMAPKDWLAVVRKNHPRLQNELLVAYASRLLALMQEANVTKVWSFKTLLRRLHDK